MQGLAYKRNRMDREQVVHSANGRFEYCGQKGFLMVNGSLYIEALHILGLRANGLETVANVIGLCQKHHQEAHCGEEAQHLKEVSMDFFDGR